MITCAEHDFIEIACLYGMEVKLTLKDGHTAQGRALQTSYNDKREECITLKTAKGPETIAQNALASMKAISHNPYFKKIHFGLN